MLKKKCYQNIYNFFILNTQTEKGVTYSSQRDLGISCTYKLFLLFLPASSHSKDTLILLYSAVSSILFETKSNNYKT